MKHRKVKKRPVRRPVRRRPAPAGYQQHYQMQRDRVQARQPRPVQTRVQQQRPVQRQPVQKPVQPRQYPKPHEYKPSPQPMPYADVHPVPEKPKRKFKLKLNWLHKLLILSFILFIIWANKDALTALGLRLVKINPTIYSIYYHIYSEVINKTLRGIFYIAAIGALFFIFIPVEVIYIAYLGYGYNPITVMLFAVTGYCLGFTIDYIIGFLLGPKVFRFLWGDKYDRFERKLNRIGSYLIIGGNIFYFPMQLLSVFFGGMRYNFIKFISYSFIGKLAQYILIFFGYKYSREYVVPFFIQSMIPWAMYMFNTYIVPVIDLFRVI